LQNFSFTDILYTVLIISIDHDTSKDDNNVRHRALHDLNGTFKSYVTYIFLIYVF